MADQELPGLLNLSRPNIPPPELPNVEQSGVFEQLNLLRKKLFESGEPRGTNQFFRGAAAPDPAQGGQANLVALMDRLQSRRGGRQGKEGIEDLVLQLMLQTAIGKSQVPQSAVEPQFNIPAPSAPGVGGAPRMF